MPTRKIVILENKPFTLKYIEEKLTARGFLVECSSDLGSTIKLALDNQPDCILIDLGIPHLDFLVLSNTLKNNPATASIPLIAIPLFNNKQELSELHVDAFISDPIASSFFTEKDEVNQRAWI
jgi:CheY-like chemotaxis protein